MRPPLVRDFVCGDVEGVVDVIRVIRIDVRDEPDGLRIRNRVREGLGERRVPWEFQDTHLLVLVLTPIRAEVGE